jgi:hypothetical protein
MNKNAWVVVLSGIFLALCKPYAKVSGFLHPQYRWPKGATIPVCFENPASGNLSGRKMVEYAIEKSWETIANLDFVFSTSACGSVNKGIRIKITDDSKVDANGMNQPNPGRPNTYYSWDPINRVAEYAKMQLNFSFQTFKGPMSPVATDSTARQKQINRMIFHYAIHEFGHAIGFLHETDRIIGKREAGAGSCDDDDGSNYVGGLESAYYDIASIMHYRCNVPSGQKHLIRPSPQPRQVAMPCRMTDTILGVERMCWN